MNILHGCLVQVGEKPAFLYKLLRHPVCRETFLKLLTISSSHLKTLCSAVKAGKVRLVGPVMPSRVPKPATIALKIFLRTFVDLNSQV